MIIDHSREKLINAAIYFVKNTKYCGITKLMKLLALLDFTHFKQTGRPVTNQIYYTWPFGPVPKRFYEELKKPIKEIPEDIAESIAVIPTEDGKFLKITAKKNFEATHFTQRELDLLQKLAFIFNDIPTEKVVEITHLKNEPWLRTKETKGMYKPIDYMLAIDELPDSLSKEEIKERIEDREAVEKVFQQ